ncbi:MAG: hypothetical protein J5I92_07485 [Thiogranum sp.]|nr:hypothetical protein [Thiogranum sp.]
MNRLSIVLLCYGLMSCGGGGGSETASPNTTSTQAPPDLSKQYFYVDPLGRCNARLPCYTQLIDAITASFETQFDAQLVAQRTAAPADRIVVMPGVYQAADPSDFVFIVGLVRESYPTGKWKLEIIAEQGPEQTFITGLGIGPCIHVSDHIDLVISGFTITGCSEYRTGYVNEDYAVFLQSYFDADIVIENNVFDGNLSEEGAIAISPWFLTVHNLNLRITRNVFKNNQGGIDIYQFPQDTLPEYSASVIIDNNLVHNNQSGIWILSFTNAIHNVSIDILNNTINNNAGTGLSVHQTNGMNVLNNIVYGNGLDIRGNEHEYNYWDRYGVMESGNIISHNLVGEDSQLFAMDNIVADPLFTDTDSEEFAPLASSPAIDSGALYDIGAIQYDLLGNPRVRDGNNDLIDMPDIGAIEVQ